MADKKDEVFVSKEGRELVPVEPIIPKKLCA